jgi:hypothetical protein
MPVGQAPQSQSQALALRPGQLVRVRTILEIAPTLDAQGSLDGMPFMPEMLQYCGRTFRVSRRADKTCAGAGTVRRMHNAVHLADLRCDGASHGGCQAACLLFWNEAWLEPVEEETTSPPTRSPNGEESEITEALVEATKATGRSNEVRYRCQATEIPNASTPLRFRELDQYVTDAQNWGIRKIFRGLVVELFNLWQSFARRRFPRALLIAGGRPYPFIRGPLPVKKGATPSAKLDLRPGDLVRIKSKEEIEATLDEANNNRGLCFDGEMARHCGRTARVRGRVERLVNEHTGELLEIKSDCIMLEGVVCEAAYHRFCPRGIYAYWREIWLERVDDSNGNGIRPHPESALTAGRRTLPPCISEAPPPS